MTEPDIAFFLLARITNDRKIALTAMAGVYDAPSGEWFVANLPYDGIQIGGTTWGEYGYSNGISTHIAHWDPARILAECDAKEEVVKEYLRMRDMANYDLNIIHTFTASARTATSALETALRYLALPYASHENYQEEWRL